MITVISPSKTQDFTSPIPKLDHSLPELRQHSLVLAKKLKSLKANDIAKLMDISPKLAALNFERYQEFSAEFTQDNARQAIVAFQGDVYDGLAAENFTKANFTFAQKHLRILSGLYGVLKPLDLIQPYRLEMSIKLKSGKAKDLYQFWGNKLSVTLNQALAESKSSVLINLASEEYFSAIDISALEGEVITPIFKENQKGNLKVIGLFAKKARGMMAGYMIREKINDPKQLKDFTAGGYRFEQSLSTPEKWVFVR